MKETYWGYWLVLLGVFIIGVMLLVNNISTTNTQDYYNIKEVTQASMVDAVDWSYYRLHGNIKMSEKKFVENFMRRFVENVNMANTYDVDFYGIYEVPPKVSVKISTGSRSFHIANSNNSYDVVTKLSSIIELGNHGEVDAASKKSKKLCQMFITTKLMKYFAVKADGSDYKVDGIKWGSDKEYRYGLTGPRYTGELDLDEFRRWFRQNVTLPGTGQKAGEYLTGIAAGDLPKVVKVWLAREWIYIVE